MSRIEPITLVDGAIAAVALLLGIYELWLFARRRREREHLWVALISLSAAAYSVLMAVHYNADREHAVLLSKLEAAFIGGTAIWVPMLANAVSARRLPVSVKALLVVPGLYLVMLPSAWIIPDEVVAFRYGLSDRPFWRYVETVPSNLFVSYAVVLVIGVSIWMVRNRRGEDQVGRNFAIAAIVWALVGGVDVVLGLLRVPPPLNLFEIGYVGVALSLVWGHADRYMRMLDATERDFRAVIERSPDAALGVRGERLIYVNEALVRVLGYDSLAQLNGRPLEALIHADDLAAVGEQLGVPATDRDLLLLRALRQDGGLVHLESAFVEVDWEGSPATVIIGRDVTSRHQLAARLMEMDRLASVGTLAASVGHEINNPLTYVTVNIQEAERIAAGRGDEELRELLADANEGVGRIRETVEVLRFFSRPHKREGAVDLARVIRSAAAMAGNEIRHRAKLALELEPGIALWGNETRLGQVFVNLLVNAAQAIPDGAKQKHEIRVRCHRDGRHARFEVSDTGRGIEDERLAHIFDPFCTTKDPGEGTGLGLAISNETIRAMGGELSVSSQAGVGSTFRGHLPIQEAVDADPAARAAEDEAASRPARARVLVVDDEPMVLRSTCRMLDPHGEIVGVGSVAEALEQLEAEGTFDLIFSDVMMPEGSGMDLYDALGEQHPELVERVVFMSGGVFTREAQAFRERSGAPFVCKPLEEAELKHHLRRAVERAEGRAEAGVLRGDEDDDRSLSG